VRIPAESGDPASQADLANLFLEGAPEDRAKAAGWFEQAALSGDLVAAFNFGLCLAKGVGLSATSNRQRIGSAAQRKGYPMPNTSMDACWLMDVA
jgi:TPR repeat protein